MISSAIYILITIDLNAWGKKIRLRQLLSIIVIFIVSKIIDCNILIYYLATIMLQRGLGVKRVMVLQCTYSFWVLLKHVCVALNIHISVNYHAVPILS